MKKILVLVRYFTALNMANVVLKDIYKVYDKDVTAVNNVSLEVADKEFIVLVGPSGCGKSTTLRMIAGLEEISKGQLFIGEKQVNDVAPKDRDIAMVFQNYALYPHMNVYDNMAFALKLRKIKKDEVDRRVRDAAKILGIEALLARKPKQLSGGQRQRVAIGRAIVRNPKVFLMDEPLSNLDAKLRNQMRSEIIKLHKRLNTTFIYVTHDQTEAMTLGDRIVVMKSGVVQQVDTPHRIFNSPANIFVAGFIGTPQMNFFDNVDLMEIEGSYCIKLFGNIYRLPDEKQKILRNRKSIPKTIVVGIRPEDFTVGSIPGKSIETEIEVSELMGSEVYLHVRFHSKNVNFKIEVDETDEDKVAYAVLKVKADFDINAITATSIIVYEEKLHLFDRDNQQSLFAGRDDKLPD